MAPELELNAKKIELLLRAALLDDAANTGERLGALLADIGVDDDGDAWVSLDIDLWPEDKDPSQAIAVAKLLGVELELLSTDMTMPFHWPALAEFANSTTDYVTALLDAYAGRQVNIGGQ